MHCRGCVCKGQVPHGIAPFYDHEPAAHRKPCSHQPASRTPCPSCSPCPPDFFCLYKSGKVLSKLSVTSLVVVPPPPPPAVLKPLASTVTAPNASYATGAIVAPKSNRL